MSDSNPRITNHLMPDDHKKVDLGSASRSFRDGYFEDITADTATVTTETVSSQTVSGTLSVTGTLAATGATTGLRRAASVTSEAGPTALSAAQSGLVVVSTATSGTQVFTLPLAATAGLEFSFVCGHADTEIHVGVGTGDNIIGKTHGAENATGLSSTATTGLLKNTAATNVVGDFVTLVSDGTTHWYMTSVAGVWSVT